MPSDTPKPPNSAPPEASSSASAPVNHPSPAPELDSGQRRRLRSLAHPLKPVVFVGENGLSPAVLKALDDALDAHELVKVRLRQPEDKKTAAQELADATRAVLCGVVGHTVVLYRPNPEDPRIELA